MASATNESNINVSYRDAYKAAVEGVLDILCNFYTREPTSPINVYGDTVLHVLALYGHADIVCNLLELPLSRHGLATNNGRGNIALHEAARVGFVEIAEAMVHKEEGLVTTRLALEIMGLYPDLAFSPNEMGATALHLYGKELGGGDLASNKSGSIGCSKPSKPLGSKFELGRCTGLNGDGRANTSVGVDLLKDCSCSFWHRGTGRFEAHLWDNSCIKEGQTRKGRQVYEKFLCVSQLSTYEKELEEMKQMTKLEYVASIRRTSSGFSRGASVYRGVTRLEILLLMVALEDLLPFQ
ncbi:hypothetical protein HHK36_013296 [Tetracentron sinense]|uniref:Uncharacterized protein n=1 Tax=Tetracentron sinense TaxID=13715 RepID=A0A834Z9K2_TETSI|nr:hypothetical protein HHK36_013296 [Tetracentron sinense]